MRLQFSVQWSAANGFVFLLGFTGWSRFHRTALVSVGMALECGERPLFDGCGQGRQATATELSGLVGDWNWKYTHRLFSYGTVRNMYESPGMVVSASLRRSRKDEGNNDAIVIYLTARRAVRRLAAW